ncbi:MAG: hypothetical protein P0S95_00730 [Rhabdochlamydiaceae bacterium]|nr:hypothetical protein [Candidatus Amphrikana amoebophyrae]
MAAVGPSTNAEVLRDREVLLRAEESFREINTSDLESLNKRVKKWATGTSPETAYTLFNQHLRGLKTIAKDHHAQVVKIATRYATNSIEVFDIDNYNKLDDLRDQYNALESTIAKLENQFGHFAAQAFNTTPYPKLLAKSRDIHTQTGKLTERFGPRIKSAGNNKEKLLIATNDLHKQIEQIKHNATAIAQINEGVLARSGSSPTSEEISNQLHEVFSQLDKLEQALIPHRKRASIEAVSTHRGRAVAQSDPMFHTTLGGEKYTGTQACGVTALNAVAYFLDHNEDSADFTPETAFAITKAGVSDYCHILHQNRTAGGANLGLNCALDWKIDALPYYKGSMKPECNADGFAIVTQTSGHDDDAVAVEKEDVIRSESPMTDVHALRYRSVLRNFASDMGPNEKRVGLVQRSGKYSTVQVTTDAEGTPSYRFFDSHLHSAASIDAKHGSIISRALSLDDAARATLYMNGPLQGGSEHTVPDIYQIEAITKTTDLPVRFNPEGLSAQNYADIRARSGATEGRTPKSGLNGLTRMNHKVAEAKAKELRLKAADKFQIDPNYRPTNETTYPPVLVANDLEINLTATNLQSTIEHFIEENPEKGLEMMITAEKQNLTTGYMPKTGPAELIAWKGLLYYTMTGRSMPQPKSRSGATSAAASHSAATLAAGAPEDDATTAANLGMTLEEYKTLLKAQQELDVSRSQATTNKPKTHKELLSHAKALSMHYNKSDRRRLTDAEYQLALETFKQLTGTSTTDNLLKQARAEERAYVKAHGGTFTMENCYKRAYPLFHPREMRK